MNPPPADDALQPGASKPAAFVLVWDVVADIIGTSATAAIVRRAARRASAKHPGLTELAIARKAFTPEYQLPQSWLDDPTGVETSRQFHALCEELALLLRELTGTVVLRRISNLGLPLDEFRDAD